MDFEKFKINNLTRRKWKQLHVYMFLEYKESFMRQEEFQRPLGVYLAILNLLGKYNDEKEEK